MITLKTVIGKIELARVAKCSEKAKKEALSRDIGEILDKGIEWLGVRAKLPKKVKVS